MTLFNKEQNVLITDSRNRLMHLCDLNGKIVSSINPDDCLKRPGGICIGTNKQGEEEIYVYDWLAETVFVFSRNFKLIKKIGEKLKFVNYIAIDSENKILYCSQTSDDVVSCWNVNNGKLTDKIKIELPFHLEISLKRIYIVSQTDHEYDWKRIGKKLEKLN